MLDEELMAENAFGPSTLIEWIISQRLLNSSKGQLIIVAMAFVAFMVGFDKIDVRVAMEYIVGLVALYSGTTAIEDFAEKSQR